MRQNLWTVLTVFAMILGLASFLNRGKVRQVGLESAALHQPRAFPPQSPVSPSLSSATATPPAEDTAAVTQALSQIPPEPSSGDSIPRTPPQGVAFAGSGRFQLYRQGDITWRLDTETGSTCILFATDTQWRLPRVFAHGCGST